MKTKENVFLRIHLILLIIITICVIASNVTAGNETYTYDNAGRLTMVDYGDGNTITYTYDAAGNRLTMTSSALVSVPDVVSFTQADAESVIAAAGLTVGAVSSADSDTVPAGDVISQDPLAGAVVESGSAVDMVVSTGPVAGIPGDLDGDSDIDRNDLSIILAARNTPASGPDDPRDLDGDGMITALDARILVGFCTRPRCETE